MGSVTTIDICGHTRTVPDYTSVKMGTYRGDVFVSQHWRLHRCRSGNIEGFVARTQEIYIFCSERVGTVTTRIAHIRTAG